MKIRETFAAGETVAQIFDRSADAQAAAGRLRTAGFSDVRLSEHAGQTSAEHVSADVGTTEFDFGILLERAGFAAERAAELTRAVASGAVLLTVAAGARVADAAAVLRGESVAARPLGPVDVRPSGETAIPRGDAPAVASAPGVASPAPAPAPAAGTGVEPGDRILQLRAERLDVTKQRATSDARIRKEVVTEEKTITVPVSREQLVVERDGEPTVRIPLTDTGPG